MRWEERLLGFFDDLEQQAEGLALAERDAEVPELARAAYATVDVDSRMHASVGRHVALRVAGLGDVSGRLQRAGHGWCLLEATTGMWVVRVGALVTARGLSERALGGDYRGLPARVGLGSVLRGLAETGVPLTAYTLDGLVLTGRVRRVGADFAELWAPTSAAEEAAWQLVPFAAVGAFRPMQG